MMIWFLPQQAPQSRTNLKQHLQFGVVILCLVCLLPSRLVFRSQKWRFPSLRPKKATATSRSSNHKAINTTAECRYFPEAMFQFTNALRQTPEQTALRPWSLRTLPQKYPEWYFPGLSSQLIDEVYRGKRIALVGDSTIFYLARWMQTLLSNYTASQDAQLQDMDMTPANYAVNPDMDEQAGWSNSAPAELRLSDGTVVVWDGRRGSPGESACQFDSVWKHIFQEVRPGIVVVNFGLHWLHLMGAGRDVPLCYVQAWLNYENWLASIVKMAKDSGSVRLLLFKTTNYICVDQFWGDYADAAALFQSEGKNVETARNKCRHLIQELVRDSTRAAGLPVDMLGAENITRYCERAVFNDYGVKDLNHRLLEFVQKQQQQQQKQRPSNNMTIAIFNDHDLQSCAYSAPNDGRHYHPLNLMRIRLLANMIQCLYKE